MCRPDDYPPYGEATPVPIDEERQARGLAQLLLAMQLGSVEDAIALSNDPSLPRRLQERVVYHIRRLGKGVE